MTMLSVMTVTLQSQFKGSTVFACSHACDAAEPFEGQHGICVWGIHVAVHTCA